MQRIVVALELVTRGMHLIHQDHGIGRSRLRLCLIKAMVVRGLLIIHGWGAFTHSTTELILRVILHLKCGQCSQEFSIEAALEEQVDVDFDMFASSMTATISQPTIFISIIEQASLKRYILLLRVHI